MHLKAKPCFDVFGTLFDLYNSLYKLLSKGIIGEDLVKDFLRDWRNLQLKLTMINTLLGKEHGSFESIAKHS